MKKQYSKPGIIIEDFAIAQSIAASCGASHNSNLGAPMQWSKTTCGWDAGGAIIWTTNNDGCGIKLKEDAQGFGVCYNNPGNGVNIFSS